MHFAPHNVYKLCKLLQVKMSTSYANCFNTNERTDQSKLSGKFPPE